MRYVKSSNMIKNQTLRSWVLILQKFSLPVWAKQKTLWHLLYVYHSKHRKAERITILFKCFCSIFSFLRQLGRYLLLVNCDLYSVIDMFPSKKAVFIIWCNKIPIFRRKTIYDLLILVDCASYLRIIIDYLVLVFIVRRTPYDKV